MSNSESLHCNVCGQPATVHLTQIINNQIHKVDLCEACAQYKGVTDPDGFSLADLLAKSLEGAAAVSAKETHKGALECPTCGYTLDHFKKYGRLGCSDCYQALKVAIDPILGNMHKDVLHRGKIPQHSVQRITYQQKIIELDKKMGVAIKEERYEDAAKLRDEIEKIKLTLEATTSEKMEA